MNWDIAEGNWKQLVGKVETEWGKLTEDRLRVTAGERVELAGRMQESYGISKDEADQQLKAFRQINKDCRPKSSSSST